MLYDNLASSAVKIISRPFAPSMIVIGEPNLDNTISDLAVSLGGRNTIKIEGQAHVTAFMKYMMEGSLGADVKIGMAIKIATGFMANTPLQFQATNSAATTPEVRGYSEAKDGTPVTAAQESIQANSSTIFEGLFKALIFPTTNFSYANIEFADGHTETEMGLPEIRSMFLEANQADADGELGGMMCIDNGDGRIVRATLFTDSGGSLVVKNIGF